MSTLADQPAFPGISDSRAGCDSYNNRYTAFETINGMTLRQHYAGLAMQALASAADEGGQWATLPDETAKQAVAYADALIAELEKPTS